MSAFIARTFHHQFVLSKRFGGHFHTLSIQKTEEVIRFLNDFAPYAHAIPSTRKKLDWEDRLDLEKAKHPDTSVVVSKAENDYTEKEIQFIIQAKQEGMTDAKISMTLNRTYWFVVYKWQDSKKNILNEDLLLYIY